MEIDKLNGILLDIGTSNPCENNVDESRQAFIGICFVEFFGYGTNRTGFEKIWALKLEKMMELIISLSVIFFCRAISIAVVFFLIVYILHTFVL